MTGKPDTTKPPMDLFQPDQVAKERALVEAERDMAAGRLVGMDEVERWLRSWGSEKPLPPPCP